MNIVLTGFMATGKTQISQCLAERLGYELRDTDEMIVESAGMSINDIFAQFGEEHFRRIEAEIIKQAAKGDRAIISTGGGVVLNPQNIDVLRGNGIIVNLSPEFKVIQERIAEAAATRPLMKGQSIEEIKKRFDDRKPFYDNCDIKINVTNDKTPMEHAEEIINILKDRREWI